MDLKKAKPKKKTWHEKFKELAREVGADESESAFADKLRRIAPTKKKQKAPKADD